MSGLESDVGGSSREPSGTPKLWLQLAIRRYIVLHLAGAFVSTAAIILFAVGQFMFAGGLMFGALGCWVLFGCVTYRTGRTRRYAQGVQASTAGDHPPGTVLCPWCLYPVVPESVITSTSNQPIETHDQVRRCQECGQTFWTNWAKWIWKDGEISPFGEPPAQGPRE